MTSLKLNDGSVFENSSALESDGILFVYVSGYNIKQVFDGFYNSEASKKIVYTFGNEKITFSGYKNLISVREEREGFVSASLRK
jgi:hypothetical protein